MRFKNFIINEWFTFPEDRTAIEIEDIDNLAELIDKKDYFKAELLIEKLVKRYELHLKDVKLLTNSIQKEKELKFTLNILNKIHEINVSTPEIRNVETKNYDNVE